MPRVQPSKLVVSCAVAFFAACEPSGQSPWPSGEPAHEGGVSTVAAPIAYPSVEIDEAAVAETLARAVLSPAALAGARARMRPLPKDALAKVRFSVPERMFHDPSDEFLIELADEAQRADLTSVRGKARSLETLGARLAALKSGVFGFVRGLEVERDYSHLPLALVRVPDVDALTSLLLDPRVVAVHENVIVRPELEQSLPVIQQAKVERLTPIDGRGLAVAVIDTGVDFTQPEFGTCAANPSAPWQPVASAGCRVVRSLDFADADGLADDHPVRHGTNVAAIAASVAPQAQIISLDVFTWNDANGDLVAQNNEFTATFANIASALNWVAANQTTFNIVAANMSIGSIQDLDGDNVGNQVGDVDGDGVGDLGFTDALCPTGLDAALNAVLAAGTVPVATAGNDGLVGTVGSIGCNTRVVTVGAQFDEDDIGAANVDNNALVVALGAGNGFDVGLCTNNRPQAFGVVCFSNSSGQVELVAPGFNITAGGVTLNGTSMAAPHVAGAVALLAQAGFNTRTNTPLTAQQLRADLQATRRFVTDTKWNGGTNMAQLDAVDSVLASSIWMPVVENLQERDWYRGNIELLELSTVGLAHRLHGGDTRGSTTPLRSHLIAPLLAASVD